MDPLNFILLVIVGIIFWRLRSVLGTRNDEDNGTNRHGAYGLNRDAFQQQSKSDAKKGKSATVAKPKARKKTARKAPNKAANDDRQASQIGKDTNIDDGAPEGRGLAFLRQQRPGFDESDFLSGAKRAYEMVLAAFAAGDLSLVESFLGADVKGGFETAIKQRQQTSQKLMTEITRLDRPTIEDAMIEGGMVRLAVRYRAEIISYQAADENDEADEAARPVPTLSRDLWTFEQELDSRAPVWTLIATEAD